MTGVQTCALPICFPVTIKVTSKYASSPVVSLDVIFIKPCPNLEWVTPRENNNWSLAKTIFMYDLNGRFIKTYVSGYETKQDGFNRSHVANVCRGIERQHKGYLFSYKKLTKEQVIQRLSKTHYVRYPKYNGSE